MRFWVVGDIHTIEGKLIPVLLDQLLESIQTAKQLSDDILMHASPNQVVVV